MLFESFQVGEDFKFPIHRSILACCSDKFKAMFRADSAIQQFTITEIEPQILTVMLEYIYSQTVKPEMVSLDLLCGADLYGIEGLVRTCERKLICELKLDNVVDTLIAVHGTCAKYLLKAASTFFLREYYFLKSGEVSRLERSKPEMLGGLIKLSLERYDDLSVRYDDLADQLEAKK